MYIICYDYASQNVFNNITLDTNKMNVFTLQLSTHTFPSLLELIKIFYWSILHLFTYFSKYNFKGTQNLKSVITIWWWDCEKICCRFVPVRLMSFHPLYLLRFLSIWRKTYVFFVMTLSLKHRNIVYVVHVYYCIFSCNSVIQNTLEETFSNRPRQIKVSFSKGFLNK